MKKAAMFLMIWLAMCAAIYGAFAFVLWDASAAEWGRETRAFLSWICMMLAFAAVAIVINLDQS